MALSQAHLGWSLVIVCASEGRYSKGEIGFKYWVFLERLLISLMLEGLFVNDTKCP